MYQGLLDHLFDRLERQAPAFYWTGCQDGLTHGALLVVLAWLVSGWVRMRT